MTHAIPRILIAGTASGVGKTTVVAGLIAAFRARGIVVQPFKCGPDYLDPTHHTQAAGRPCLNLDSWMLDDDQVRAAFIRGCRGADIAIIEGVMGLFDGSGYEDERGSAAHIARLLEAPVLLVMDIARSARSAAAVALGFTRFDPDLRLAGVILNQAGSDGHATGCAAAITQATGLPVLGSLLRDAALRIPERHLGLVPSGERPARERLCASLAEAVSARFRLTDIEATLHRAPPLPDEDRLQEKRSRPPEPGPILAVARDEAFSFYYPDTLDLLGDAGARIVFFSPVHGDRLPEGAAGVYLGGGYPELHGRALAANTGLWADMRALHQRGGVVWAECGGFMALTEALVDLDGATWPMAGLLPGTTRMTDRLASFGYRQVMALTDNLLAPRGRTLRGHEFHHSIWEVDPHRLTDCAAWRAQDSRGTVVDPAFGYASGSLLASYLHIHLGQDPQIALRLLDRLRATAPATPPTPLHT